MKAFELQENATFQVPAPYTMYGNPDDHECGCKVTLLPNVTYTVEQVISAGDDTLIVAEGDCHIQQTVPCVIDKVQKISFTMDNIAVI